MAFEDFARERIKDVLFQTSFSVGGDVTVNTITRTLDSYGRVTGTSTSTSTVKGYLRIVTSSDKELIAQGIVEVGEAMFYTTHDVTLNPQEDTLTQNNETWEVIELIEAPVINGKVVHQTFRCRKK